MHPDNLKAVKRFGLCHGFKVCTGARYLSGFIGDDESKRDCLKVCTNTWERNITKISKTTGKYPQENYATVVCAIQLERIFLQCVKKNSGDVFVGVEKLLRENFLLQIFFEK